MVCPVIIIPQMPGHDTIFLCMKVLKLSAITNATHAYIAMITPQTHPLVKEAASKSSGKMPLGMSVRK